MVFIRTVGVKGDRRRKSILPLLSYNPAFPQEQGSLCLASRYILLQRNGPWNLFSPFHTSIHHLPLQTPADILSRNCHYLPGIQPVLLSITVPIPVSRLPDSTVLCRLHIPGDPKLCAITFLLLRFLRRHGRPAA